MTGNFLPIPGLKEKVPVMVANLKKLDLLEQNRIQLKHNDSGSPIFERVASTDSPFREMVVWAYLRVTGRPGLPEINIDHWLEDIDFDLSKEQT